MLEKRQDAEEPCEVISSTVLKTNGVGDNLVEFNQKGHLSDHQIEEVASYVLKQARKGW